jgi:hypothetical protein
MTLILSLSKDEGAARSIKLGYAHATTHPPARYVRWRVFPPVTKGDAMLRLVLLIVLILALLGSVPMWGYNAGWGYYPSGGLGLVLIIVLILILMGRL